MFVLAVSTGAVVIVVAVAVVLIVLLITVSIRGWQKRSAEQRHEDAEFRNRQAEDDSSSGSSD